MVVVVALVDLTPDDPSREIFVPLAILSTKNIVRDFLILALAHLLIHGSWKQKKEKEERNCKLPFSSYNPTLIIFASS